MRSWEIYMWKKIMFKIKRKIKIDVQEFVKLNNLVSHFQFFWRTRLVEIWSYDRKGNEVEEHMKGSNLPLLTTVVQVRLK